MQNQTKINEFLNKYSKGSDERNYFEIAAKILSSLPLEINQSYGFACMQLLESVDIEFTDGVYFDRDFETFGTIEDIAELIGIYFSEINSTLLWWKVNYIEERKKNETIEITKSLFTQIQKLQIVKVAKLYL